MAEHSARKGREIEGETHQLLSQESKISIPEDEEIVTQQYFDGRQIHRVPDHLLLGKEQKKKDELYTPKMVSFGPYHHGLPHLRKTEASKPEIVTMFISESGRTRQVFYNRMFKVIHQVRNSYADDIRDKYDDEGLAEMMLRDACFAIFLMQEFLRSNQGISQLFSERFGPNLVIACTDMCLLENQIPFWVVKLLINLIYTNNKEEGSKLLYNFTCARRFGIGRPLPAEAPQEFPTLPLHVQDAFHFITCAKRGRGEEEENLQRKNSIIHQLIRSVTQRKTRQGVYDHASVIGSVSELKAKGISFKRSSYCLKDVKFNSFMWSGELELPFFFIDEFSKSWCSNQIAFEASPSNKVELTIINYISFLKSLVLEPQDAEELRERNILVSNYSNKQVVEIIQELECWGSLIYLFEDVKREVNEHCNSKRKTWMAELIHTYFRSPWSVIALLAATFLLFLSILQTYYSVYPKNSPDNHASPRAPSAT